MDLRSSLASHVPLYRFVEEEEGDDNIQCSVIIKCDIRTKLSCVT